jgi:hypothetical protein
MDSSVQQEPLLGCVLIADMVSQTAESAMDNYVPALGGNNFSGGKKISEYTNFVLIMALASVPLQKPMPLEKRIPQLYKSPMRRPQILRDCWSRPVASIESVLP